MADALSHKRRELSVMTLHMDLRSWILEALPSDA